MTQTPTDPSAWLLRVARRCAIDLLRSRKRLSEADVETLYAQTHEPEPCIIPEDETLHQLIACAIPQFSPVGRTMFMLRTVCDLSTAQIARVYGMKESAAAQRLVRIRRGLTPEMIRVELTPGLVAERLPSVLDAIYLTFTVGFHSTEADPVESMEFIDESLRLALILASDPRTDGPGCHAMTATMLFHAARLGARRDKSGRLLSLAEQDRSRWNQRHIDLALRHLASSASGDYRTRYHLHAQIAMCHAMAPGFEMTAWSEILSCHEALLRLEARPAFTSRLAYLVAMSYARSPRVALPDALEFIKDPNHAGDYRTHALLADLYSRLNQRDKASEYYLSAAALAPSVAEREWFASRLEGEGG